MSVYNTSRGQVASIEVQLFDSVGQPVNLPWATSNTAPLVYASEIRTIAANEDFDRSIHINIQNRFEALKKFKQDGYTVILNGETITNNEEFLARIGDIERQFLEFATQAWESSLNAKIAELDSGSARSARRRSKRSGPEWFRQIADLRRESESRSSEALLGPEDNALQIGWITFGGEHSAPDRIRLGPDKIVFADFNNVMTADSLRSDTDIALKRPDGRGILDIDLVFPSVDAINGSAVKDNVPGLRDLIGMLRMSPVVPVSGKAVGAALINRITASEVYEDIKDLFFQDSSKTHQEVFDEAREQLTEDQFEMTLGGITDMLRDERSTYDLLMRHLKRQTESDDDQDFNNKFYQGKPPNKRDLVDTLGVHAVLTPLVFRSMTLSTVASAPGAVRVRLTFERMHNPYETAGGLSFYDYSGDGTFDVRKASPLRDGVSAVYLSPKRAYPTVDGKLQYRDNPYYLPVIGDVNNSKAVNMAIAGFERNADNPRQKINEMGFITYAPTRSIGIEKSYSPIMFRFAAAANPLTTYEYIPNDMQLVSASFAYSNKIASFPMEGSIYPGFQYMGRAAVTAALQFTTTSKKAVQRFFTAKAVMDQQAQHLAGPEFMRREYLDVYNDILALSGVHRWVISAARMETAPDNPDLYTISVELVSNMESAQEREKISYVSQKAPEHQLKQLWWWMYAGLALRYFGQNDAISGPPYINEPPASRIRRLLSGQVFGASSGVSSDIQKLFSDGGKFADIGSTGKDKTHTDAELETIWRTVFGRDKDNSFVPGFMQKDLFIAAFLEMFNDGQVHIGNLKTAEMFSEWDGQASQGSLDDLNNYFAHLFSLLKKGAHETWDLKENVPGGVDGDFVYLDNWLKRIAEYYEKQVVNGGDFVTPWWISNSKTAVLPQEVSSLSTYGQPQVFPGYFTDTQGPGDTKYLGGWIRDLARFLNKNANDNNNHRPNILQANNNMSMAWIPTPAMWEQMYKIMSNYRSYADMGTGGKKSYAIQRNNGLDVHPFLVSAWIKFAKHKLIEIASALKYRKHFPSFWKKIGLSIEDYVGRLSLDGDSTNIPIKIDPGFFEHRNNYPDLPMPRYMEIFGNNVLGGEDNTYPQPRKDGAGFEVWRKVAPSYIELGIEPDLYSSLSMLTEPDAVSPASPGLLTPRSFYDYCDPGYFLFRRSWLAEQYNELKDDIDDDIASGTLSPTPNKRDFGLSDNEEKTLNRIREMDKKNGTRIVIGRPSMSLQSRLTPKVTRTEWEREWDAVARHYAQQLIKEIKIQAQAPTIAGSTTSEQEKLFALNIGAVERVFVVDATGRDVGVIVSSAKKPNFGTAIRVEELRHISTRGQQRQADKASNRPKGEEFWYVVLNDQYAQTPWQVKYRDTQAVLEHNMYQDEGAKNLYLSTLGNLGDIKQNHIRAYPTFKLFFVKEKVDGDHLVSSLEEDMYGYSSIISLDVVLDKNDAAVAKVVVTDISGVLGTAVYKSDTQDLYKTSGSINGKPEKVKDGQGADADTLFTTESYQKVKLETGTNILIKMGYGNDPETLKTVFTGSIAEIEYGPITTFVAQGYKTELFRQVNFYESVTISKQMLDLVFNHNNLNPIGPTHLVWNTLRRLHSLPGVTTHNSAGGIPHLGRFLSLVELNAATAELASAYNQDPSNYTKLKDENAKYNNDIDILIGLGLGLAGAVTVKALPRAGVTLMTGSAVSLTGAATEKYGVANVVSWLRKYSSQYSHTNALRNVFITDDPRSDGWLDRLNAEWLADGDGWSVLKEITRYKVGYVCQVLPYGQNATLFIGKPDQPYHYKPVSERMKALYESASPFSRFASFSMLYSKIIGEFFASPEYGLNTVHQQWANFMGRTDGWDDSGRFVPLSKFVQRAVDRVNSTVNASEKFVANAFLINTIHPFLQDMKEFPSYAISRYIVDGLKGSIKESSGETHTANAGALFTIAKQWVEDDSINTQIEYGLNGHSKEQLAVILNDNFVVGGDVGVVGIKTNLGPTVDPRIRKKVYTVDDVTSGWIKGFSDSQLAGAGYSEGDHWAVYLSGDLVPKRELMRTFSIDTRSGRSVYDTSPIDNDRQKTVIPFLSFSFATTSGYGTFDLRKFGWTNQRDVANVKFKSIESGNLILISDHTEDLNYIRKYSDGLERVLFAIYFGLVWSKVNDTETTFLGLSGELEETYKEYANLVMKGIGRRPDDIWMSAFDKIDELYRGLSTQKGVLSKLKDKKYGQYASPGKSIDPELLSNSIKMFDIEVRKMVAEGRIRPEEKDGVLKRFRQFIRLAGTGSLAGAYVENVYDEQSVVNAAKEFVFVPDEAVTLRDRVSGITAIIDDILRDAATTDPAKIDAYTELAGLDPASRKFDPGNPSDLVLLRSRLQRPWNDYTEREKDVMRSLDIYPLIEEYTEGLVETIPDISRLGDALSYEDIDRVIGSAKNTGALAIGAKSDITMRELMIYNADYYKLFLMFFAKWLRNNGNEDKSLRAARVHDSLGKFDGERLKPGTKRFVDVHYVISGTDIIENRIKATTSEMANNILLMSPREVEVTKLNFGPGENSGEDSVGLFKIDSMATKMNPYPNYQYNGVDWNPYIRPELRKQRTVVERNAETDQQRLSLLINHMSEAIRPMYRGYITVTGRVMKPYDRIVLIDTNKDMYGIFEVDRVVHKFDSENGWTTKIVPCAWVNPMEPSSDLLGKFDTMNTTRILQTLDVASWVLDAWFWAGIILAPFTAATSAAAGTYAKSAGGFAMKKAAEQVTRRTMAGTVKNWMVAGMTKVGQGVGKVARGLGNAANRPGTEGIANILKNTRAALGSHPQVAWRALTDMAVTSFVGGRALKYGLGGATIELTRWGTGMVMNNYTEHILRSSTLPISTYCLTRFGRPIQAGLDQDVTRYYSYMERFGYNAESVYNGIVDGIQEAFSVEKENLTKYSDIIRNVQGK